MCSGSRTVALACALLCGGALADPVPILEPPPKVEPAKDRLRVCADPNNLPYSDVHGGGFENRIAAMIAHDFGEPMEYTWMPQRRGFVRTTLKIGRCDVIMGVPAGYELTAVTRPYYRSSYVFVTRAKDDLHLTGFGDERLRRLKIGIHLVGDDYENPPPAQALAVHDLASNVRGFPIYGDYSRAEPTRALIDAVASGDIDVAIGWGPIAGWAAQHSSVPLSIDPIADEPDVTMTFAIGIGVRRGDTALKKRIEQELIDRRADIAAILTAYGVPPAAGEERDP